MACSHVRIGDGMTAIVCGGRRVPTCKSKRGDGSTCGAAGEFQCDWKITKTRTCDRYICKAHAKQVDTNKHLCPDHQLAYDLWISRTATR